MKKILSILLALSLMLSITACKKASDISKDTKELLVGMVCIGDENSAYDRNFYQAADKATNYYKSKGIDLKWIYKYNNPIEVADDCAELAEQNCAIVFCNSYGQEPQMLITAEDYPDTIFMSATNYASQADDALNTINGMPDISQGRYLAGVAAGCKLQQMIDEGQIAPEEAVIGYVGAYTYSEVISGYSAFYLGARSVCPNATMLVEFIGSWGDTVLEASATQDLIDRGALIISQHSDNTAPATTAQRNGVFHIGYNIAMSDVAPEASIISTKIDWTNYFIAIIDAYLMKKDIPQDYVNYGLENGDIVLTDLNEAIAAPGTAEKIAEAKAALESGALHVFDISKFTVNGQQINSSMIDITADFIPDIEAVFDGYFHECYYCSAPQFAEHIDGITLVNEAF